MIRRLKNWWRARQAARRWYRSEAYREYKREFLS